MESVELNQTVSAVIVAVMGERCTNRVVASSLSSLSCFLSLFLSAECRSRYSERCAHTARRDPQQSARGDPHPQQHNHTLEKGSISGSRDPWIGWQRRGQNVSPVEASARAQWTGRPRKITHSAQGGPDQHHNRDAMTRRRLTVGMGTPSTRRRTQSMEAHWKKVASARRGTTAICYMYLFLLTLKLHILTTPLDN